MHGYDKDLEDKIEEGIKLYNKGDYPRVLEFFRMVVAKGYPRERVVTNKV